MKYEYFFKSEADGLGISVMEILPDEKPYRGVVQLVHGMSEHKERYGDFMNYLCGLGYVTVIHDHRGHGKSVYAEEDRGYMYGGGARAILQDIHSVNVHMHKKYPGLPVILLGHSMGSLAVRAYAAGHDDRMDMLIVCGSPSYHYARRAGVLIARAEGMLKGSRHRSRLLEGISFGSYALRFRNDSTCKGWICSDPEVVKEYDTSALCGFTFTDDAYLALFDLMKQAYDISRWRCTNPRLPVLFISGAEDPCLGNVRKFAATVQGIRKAGYLDVKGKLYPGMRHEILNEIEKEKVYHDIAVYMKKKGL